MRRIFCFVIVLAMATSSVSAEERSSGGSAGSSSKARVIGAVAGAAGGFLLGIFAGLNWFDDATDSDRKVWTTAIAFGAGGGVGGYFLGRAVSGSRRNPAPSIRPVTVDRVSVPAIRLRRPAALMPSRAANARLRAALSGDALSE